MLIRSARLLMSAVLASVVAGAGEVRAAQERPFPLITVAGEATLTIAPDQAHTVAGVTTQGKSASEAADANNKTMASVVEAATNAGIPAADIQTARFSIHPVYAQPPSGQPNRTETPRVVAYRVSNQVTVKIRDVARVAEILDRLIAAGASDINGVSFSLSDPEKVLDATRPKAVANARRKAELYAKAAGAQVGRVISLEETGVSPPSFRTMAPAAAMDRAAPPISPGESTLRVNVTVSFELLH